MVDDPRCSCIRSTPMARCRLTGCTGPASRSTPARLRDRLLGKPPIQTPLGAQATAGSVASDARNPPAAADGWVEIYPDSAGSLNSAPPIKHTGPVAPTWRAQTGWPSRIRGFQKESFTQRVKDLLSHSRIRGLQARLTAGGGKCKHVSTVQPGWKWGFPCGGNRPQARRWDCMHKQKNSGCRRAASERDGPLFRRRAW